MLKDVILDHTATIKSLALKRKHGVYWVDVAMIVGLDDSSAPRRPDAQDEKTRPVFVCELLAAKDEDAGPLFLSNVAVRISWGDGTKVAELKGSLGLTSPPSGNDDYRALLCLWEDGAGAVKYTLTHKDAQPELPFSGPGTAKE
jgi:hypothetical protein